jgi:hypothetical protein
MKNDIKRREFIQLTAAGGALLMSGKTGLAFAQSGKPGLISPGCRGSKVKVALLFMGSDHGLWPKPNLDFKAEMASYHRVLDGLKDELSDVNFFVNELVTSPEQVVRLKDRLAEADGILAIHFNIGINPVLHEILRQNKPTTVFAVPYSGHEWVGFGKLREQPLGAKLECMLTSDTRRLANAVKPYRAIHHLREARILNLAERNFGDYGEQIQEKFGTRMQMVTYDQLMAHYNRISDRDAKKETDTWIKNAVAVVEPSYDEVFRSCKLALAFEHLMDEKEATVMTVDCYGTMWDKTIKLPAYPCVGFTRLNNMGLAGICESDIRAAVTHIIFQGLTGRPAYISDPTVDESDNTIILAHCLGTTKMDGPDGPAAPYKLRTIMEREQGVVPQVRMRIGQKVTQAILANPSTMPYFTGTIVDAPVSLKDDRGCRTKITVKVDGDVTRLWQNWHSGLHRQTVYGDIIPELSSFCRFTGISMENEAV